MQRVQDKKTVLDNDIGSGMESLIDLDLLPIEIESLSPDDEEEVNLQLAKLITDIMRTRYYVDPANADL